MNDFERKLSRPMFRTPPPQWRDEILGAAAKVVAPPASTWRDWFWPSPQAWGAIAALWVVFAILAEHESSGATPTPATMAASEGAPQVTTLLSFHDPREINHVLNLSR